MSNGTITAKQKRVENRCTSFFTMSDSLTRNWSQNNTAIAFIFTALCFASPSMAGDHWPQFRGPDATGVVQTESNLPDQWSAEDNIAWKLNVPGRGWSSPVVWGNQVFLTTVVNSVESEAAKKGLII